MDFIEEMMEIIIGLEHNPVHIYIKINNINIYHSAIAHLGSVRRSIIVTV